MKKRFILVTCIIFFILNIFISNASYTISDVLRNKETKFFSFNSAYEIQLYYTGSTGIIFRVNNQLTKRLNVGDFDIISGANITVNNIHIEEGGTYVVNFTLHFAGCRGCDFGVSCPTDNCCDFKEVDLKTDNDNCGSCGNKCNDSFKCDNGRCVSSIVDLSDYPDFLTKDGKFDFTTIVGDKSSSINVIAQTNILSSLFNLGKDMSVKNKLASEITDLNMNIISIGNPCVNEISSKIMNNPQPCDKDFQRGKGYLKLFRNNDFFYLVVAGNTDLGTRKAAEILSNYQNYQFQGNEYTFEFAEQEAPIKIEEKKENATKLQIIEKETTQKNESKSSDITNQNKKEQKIVQEQKYTEETKTETKETQQKQENQRSNNIVSKFITWFLSFFKK